MSELAEFRKHKDQFFAHDPHSPLSSEQKRAFTGLQYYPQNPQLRFDAKIERSSDRQKVQMQTNTGELREYIKYGTFGFNVNGDTAELAVYTSGEGDCFVPFTDATSGKETYGAGRYLELHPLGGDRFLVDFNLAYTLGVPTRPISVVPSHRLRTGSRFPSVPEKKTSKSSRPFYKRFYTRPLDHPARA